MPYKVRLADAGAYEGSDIQKWLWDNWLDSWETTDRIVREHKARLLNVINGDVGDKPGHHGTTQSVSGGDEAERYILQQIYGEIKKRRKVGVHLLRGTPAHSSEAGDTEEWLGEWLRSERDEHGQWSSWQKRIEIHGLLFDFQHHGGKVGGNPRNKPNTTLMTAFDIWANHAQKGLRHPDIAVRSHLHVFCDTEHQHPTRLIITPSWQALTAFSHKLPKVANDIPDFGSVLIVVEPDGQYEVIPLLYTPNQPPVWRP